MKIIASDKHSRALTRRFRQVVKCYALTKSLMQRFSTQGTQRALSRNLFSVPSACPALTPLLERQGHVFRGRRAPQTDLAVGAPGSQLPPVAREGEGHDRTGVAAQLDDLLGGGRRPEPDSAAGVARRERLPVGRE